MCSQVPGFQRRDTSHHILKTDPIYVHTRTLKVKICVVTSLTNNPVANLLRLRWNVQHVEVEHAPEDDIPAQVQLEFFNVDLVKVEPLL